MRIIAEAAGVSERTMWRWLCEARGGRLEARPRKNGFTFSDALWAELARMGGNMSALRRVMPERQAAGTLAVWDAASVPSAGTLHRAVRDDIRAGRLLEVAPRSRTGTPSGHYDRAPAALPLEEFFDDRPPEPADADTTPDVPAVVSRARLYTPDARLE